MRPRSAVLSPDPKRIRGRLEIPASVRCPVTPGSELRGELGYAYGRAGRRDEAESLDAATSLVNPFNHALVYAGLGDQDRTLAALDRATTGGPFRIGRALQTFEMSLLHGDPRMKLLRRKVGLPD